MKKAKFSSQRNTKYIFLTRFSNITSAKDFRLEHSVKKHLHNQFSFPLDLLIKSSKVPNHLRIFIENMLH